MNPGQCVIETEHTQQRLTTADTIIVPVSSVILDRWQDELGPCAHQAGFNTVFETIGDELGIDPLLVAVALGNGVLDEQDSSRPWHYGGNWYRVRLPRFDTHDAQPDSDEPLVGLPRPSELVSLACAHFGVEDPASQAVSTPPAGESLRAMHHRTAQTAISTTIDFANIADLQHWLDRIAASDIRTLLPEAVILVEPEIVNPDGTTTAPAVVVARTTSHCSRCRRPRNFSEQLRAGTWTCNHCATRNQPEHIAAARFEGRTDLHPADAQPITAPNLATLEAITTLGTEAHNAREHAAAAAAAWDLAAKTARQIARIGAADGTSDGKERIARWVHLAYREDLDDVPYLYPDYRWAGLDVTTFDHPYRPIVGWDAQLGELSIAHAGPLPGRWHPQIPAITRISHEAAAHPGDFIATAEASACALRDQLRPELGTDTVPVIYDPHSSLGLHCHITEPDAGQLQQAPQHTNPERRHASRSL